MGTENRAFVVLLFTVIECAVAVTYSSRLIHRFSDEAKAFRVPAKGGDWPEMGSLEYYRMLAKSDVQRQKTTGSRSQFLFSSEGSETVQLGNEFGWLHYTWIDIGMPSVSFLVVLDSGSDLLWVPCDCLQCAPLSSSYYKALDRDLNQYSPSKSNTSKHLPCSHQLCELGTNCENPKQPCPYIVNYLSDNVSSSGMLVEDIIHLISHKADASIGYVQRPVIIGCGKKQTGEYLTGVAPDGLLGLGLGEISVPSFLAKAGEIRNSFSLCFNEDDSGRIYFGDQGISSQQTTPFLPLDGMYTTYIAGVAACCIWSSCLEQTSFRALVDSGSSFTYLPNDVYQRVVKEFDRQINATRTSFNGYPWEYCYKSSSLESLKVPTVMFKFGMNNSFVVRKPIFMVNGDKGLAGFCLAIESTDGDTGIIGQNFIRGYWMVFDRENLKLGWSRSNCQEMGDGKRKPHSPLPLPTEQQGKSGGHAVAPAVAGMASTSPATTIRLISYLRYLEKLLLPLLLSLHQLFCSS